MMTALYIVFGISILINIVTIWFSVRSAKTLMEFSENISYFWLELANYHEHLDSLLERDVWQDSPEIKSLVEHTDKIRSFFPDFLEICMMSNILTDEELQEIQEQSDINIKEEEIKIPERPEEMENGRERIRR